MVTMTPTNTQHGSQECANLHETDRRLSSNTDDPANGRHFGSLSWWRGRANVPDHKPNE